LEAGVALLEAGDVSRALSLFRRLATQQPTHAAAHYYVGLCEERLGHLPQAERAYREAVRLDGTLVEARNNLGVLLLGRGDGTGAVVELEAAVRQRPDNGDGLFNLGLALEATGRFVQAADAYRRLVQLRPGDADAHVNLVAALRRGGNRAEALVAARAAVRAVPGDATTHFNLGALLSEHGDGAAAVAELKTALRLRPDYPKARAVLVKVLVREHRCDEARQAAGAAGLTGGGSPRRARRPDPWESLLDTCQNR
jgi:Flp pilus assembly protein TadD